MHQSANSDGPPTTWPATRRSSSASARAAGLIGAVARSPRKIVDDGRSLRRAKSSVRRKSMTWRARARWARSAGNSLGPGGEGIFLGEVLADGERLGDPELPVGERGHLAGQRGLAV